MRRHLPFLLILIIALAASSSYLIILRRSTGWKLEIYVDGGRSIYSLDKLKGLSEAITIEGCGEVSAIPLIGLLESSGVDLDRNIVSSITPYGSDGYHRRVEEAYLHLPNTYIQIVGAKDIADYGPLRIVIAGLPRKYWVHHLVKIDVELGRWRLILLVDGAVKGSWSVEDLSSMRVPVTIDGEEAEVIPLTSLMEEAGVGIGGETRIRAISLYGQSLEFSSVDASKIYVVVVEGSAVSEFGRLRLVSPGGSSLDHLVALGVSG